MPQAAAGGWGESPDLFAGSEVGADPLPSGLQPASGTSVQALASPCPPPGQTRGSQELDTRFQSPPFGLLRCEVTPEVCAFWGVRLTDTRALWAPGRVASDLAGWPRPAGATAGSLPLTAPLAPAAWGLPGRLQFLCKQPGRGARPLDGSSATANPARGRSASGRWSGNRVSAAVLWANSGSCCPRQGPRNYLA